jgi:hypothetical protein
MPGHFLSLAFRRTPGRLVSGRPARRQAAGRCDLHMYQDYEAKYKKIKFTQTIDPTCFNKSLFIGPNTEWTILNFPTKKRPFLKIKTTLDNGNRYEIEIE